MMPCSLVGYHIQMEVIHFFKTLVVTFKTTWHHDQKHHDSHLHHHENPRSLIVLIIYALFSEVTEDVCYFK